MGDPADKDAARREGWQNEMEQGLLAVIGLEFDKKWIRLLRVIKTQVCVCCCFCCLFWAKKMGEKST